MRQVEQAGWNTEDKQIVATFLGVSVETVEHWQTKGMPYIAGGKGGRNAYDLAAIAQWLVKQRQGLDENREKADSEAKFRDEKTRIAEFQRRKLEGELVERAAYVEIMSDVLAELRKQMDLLVRTWGDEWLDDMERAISAVEAKVLKER